MSSSQTRVMESEDSTSAAGSEPHKQQRAFYRLSRQHNSVSPSDTEDEIVVRQTDNGADVSLHYPIVTESRRGATGSQRDQSVTMTLKRKAKKFLGLEESGDVARETLWRARRIRMANRRYGGVDVDVAASTLPRQDTTDGLDVRSDPATFPRTKPSVTSYLVEGVTTLGRKVANLPPRSGRASLSRSYLPSDQTKTGPQSGDVTPADQEVFFNRSSQSGAEAGHYEELDRVVLRTARSLGDETDRPRSFGIGVAGEALGWDYKKSLRRNRDVVQQLDDLDDYRPYFTYWVTSVQFVIIVISLSLYGFGPVGIELHQGTGQVLSRGLYIEEVDYLEPSNFWLGPRPADLIHLGAKFSPCMRLDQAIETEITNAIQKVCRFFFIDCQTSFILSQESESGCCVRTDNSGCVQTRQSECSSLLSTWHKWRPAQPGPDGRLSGPVCGQDPQYCTNPKSSYGATWQDDISTWPVCKQSSQPKPSFYGESRAVSVPSSSAPRHMTCEVIARPCCIGIHGKCEVRTKEFCQFVNGHFHPEASLCSQVSCMEDVCGMLPFIRKNIPDQFYRMWTSLFLHAGLLHMVITAAVQLYLMRDLEKMCGAHRMAIIYLGSGMAGNLASAVFVPYRAESGPAGAQFGVLACLIVEVINVWPLLVAPGIALGKLMAILFIFFFLGLMPWVDNYAHITGFITGFLLSYALMPYIAFDRSIHSTTRRSIIIGLCLASVVIILTVLLLVFYYTPIYNCSWCKYLTCIPFTKDFCADQNINFKKDPPILMF